MREIKFRAWDKKQDYMAVQGTPDNETLSSFIHHWGWDDVKIKIGDIVLMQFTGLRDKNGKDIFEGDLITENVRNEFDSYTPMQTIEIYFNENTGAFRGQDRNDNLHDWSIGKNSVVVGNIWENPELLSRT